MGTQLFGPVKTLRAYLFKVITAYKMPLTQDAFQQVAEEMENPAFFHDSHFRLIYTNKAYCLEAGVTAPDALGRLYWEVFPKGNQPMSGCLATTGNFEVKSSDEVIVGNKVFLSQGFRVIDKSNNPPIFFHVLTDITNKNIAESTLTKIGSQYQILFQSSPDAIMLLDERRFYDCNPATLRIYGCPSRSDFIGRHPSQFSPPLQPNGADSMVLANEHIAKALKEGHDLFEWTHCKLDGSPFVVDVLLIAFEQDGKSVLQATVRDITDRKKNEQALKDGVKNLSEALAGTVSTMSKAMELRDPYTAGHQSGVALIACAIAKELGWNEDRITGLRMAALVHDIGKIGVPSEILTKPSKLSEFEEKLVQEHPEHGYLLLKDINFPWPIANAVRQHHERMDGSGYPLGLKDNEIILEARVLAVADELEAMSTHRPYRPALGLPFAITQIKRESGKQLDVQVVDAALRLFEGKTNLDA